MAGDGRPAGRLLAEGFAGRKRRAVRPVRQTGIADPGPARLMEGKMQAARRAPACTCPRPLRHRRHRTPASVRPGPTARPSRTSAATLSAPTVALTVCAPIKPITHPNRGPVHQLGRCAALARRFRRGDAHPRRRSDSPSPPIKKPLAAVTPRAVRVHLSRRDRRRPVRHSADHDGTEIKAAKAARATSPIAGTDQRLSRE